MTRSEGETDLQLHKLHGFILKAWNNNDGTCSKCRWLSYNSVLWFFMLGCLRSELQWAWRNAEKNRALHKTISPSTISPNTVVTVWDLLYNACTTGFPLTELERWQYGASQNAFNFFQKQYLTPPLSRVCYKTKPKPSDSGRRRQRPRNSADLAASRKSGLLSFLSEPPIRDPLFSSLASLLYPSAALSNQIPPFYKSISPPYRFDI